MPAIKNNDTNTTNLTVAEKEAGKEAKIMPLDQEAMKLNVWLNVGQSNLLSWKEDVVAAAEEKGSSLTIAEFAQKLGLSEDAARFMISEDAGLHRSHLPIYALSNLSSKLGHLLTADEVAELVKLVPFPANSTCKVCNRGVENELVRPLVDFRTGFFKMRDDGSLIVAGQTVVIDKNGKSEPYAFCPRHVGEGRKVLQDKGKGPILPAMPYASAVEFAKRRVERRTEDQGNRESFRGEFRSGKRLEFDGSNPDGREVEQPRGYGRGKGQQGNRGGKGGGRW